MSFLLLGLDSLIVCAAVGPLVDKRWRLPYAALFGVADGLAFLAGAGAPKDAFRVRYKHRRTGGHSS